MMLLRAFYQKAYIGSPRQLALDCLEYTECRKGLGWQLCPRTHWVAFALFVSKQVTLRSIKLSFLICKM